MNNTTLLDGLFKQSQEKGKEYLIYLDVDRLIAPCYDAVAQTPKKPRYGGWESTGISGHSIGHWLSAAATMYTVTGDERLKQKLEYAIDELAHVQSFDETGYVSGFPRDCYDKAFSGEFEVSNFSLGGSWVPWYSHHKIFAGLIDAYQLIGSQKALDIVIKLSDWAVNGSKNMTDEQFQRMLICEHGGMNEAMADLYVITNNRSYLDLAIRFCHKAVLDPLSKGQDELEGKHANTQIPKVVGAAKLYNITGEQHYKDTAIFFWNRVTNNRSYVIGGNSKGEHFGPENTEDLGITTTETCNTYNMLKLTELLFAWEKKAEYMDYYERALYNHILASQDPDSGMKTYFVSTEPGHFKVYCSHDNSFWCCTGTGMENPARYTRSIFTHNEKDLYVNLFISSTFSNVDNNFIIRQETAFPESNTSRLVLEQADKDNLDIHIRVPYWVTGNVTVLVNGKNIETSTHNGYLTITNEWNAGDVIDLSLPMDLHIYRAKDDSNKVAFMYGPVVLAGALGREQFPETDILDDHQSLNNHPLINVPTLVTEKELKEWLKPVEGAPLTFKTEAIGQPGNVSVTMIPFFALHHQRYTLYWNLMNEEDYKVKLEQTSTEADRLKTITIDTVQPNEQQPEVDHAIKMEQSNSDYFNIVRTGWRDARNGGFFSYEMKVEPEKEMYLVVTYFGGDRELWLDGKALHRDFDILVDETNIAHQVLEGKNPDTLMDIVYPIPYELTKGKEKIEVKFVSDENKIAGGVYGVKILNEAL
jgi:uncharacterized protein